MQNRDDRTKDAEAPLADSGRTLRQKAEALARERASQTPGDTAALSPEETRHMLHELRIRQIELEMQIEELRTTLAQSEAGRARFFNLYDSAPSGYCTLSGKGLILEANLTAAALLGAARGELINQPLSCFIFEDDQAIYDLHRQELARTGEPQECDLRLVKPDGATFWAHLTATAARTEDGAPMCCLVINDITERKRAEKALWLKNLVFDTSIAANSIADKHGVITEANDFFLKLWGYTRKDEVIGRPIASFLQNQDEVAAIITALDQTGEWQGDYTAKRGDGSVFTAHGLATVIRNDRGERTGYQSSVLDITERKRAEEALWLKNLVFDASIAANCIADRQGMITEVNDAFLRLCGYVSRDEVVGRSIANVLQDPNEAVAILTALDQTGEWQGDYTARRKDGSVFPAYGQATVIRNSKGEAVGYQSSGMDITDRRQMEHLLAFLAQSSSNPASGDFFRSLARYLSETLDMGFVCIDRLDGDNLTAHTECL